MLPADHFPSKNEDRPPAIPPRPIKLNLRNTYPQLIQTASASNSFPISSSNSKESPPPLPPKVGDRFSSSSERYDSASAQGLFHVVSRTTTNYTSNIPSTNSLHFFNPLHSHVLNQNKHASFPGGTPSVLPSNLARINNSQDNFRNGIMAYNSNTRFSYSKTSEINSMTPPTQNNLAKSFLAKKENSDLIDLSHWKDGFLAEENDMSVLNLFDPLSIPPAADDRDDQCDFQGLKPEEDQAAKVSHRTDIDLSNPWLLQDDNIEILDPFDIKALQKASELAKISTKQTITSESEITDSSLDRSPVKHRTIKNTLKYRKKINSICDSLDNSEPDIHCDPELSNLCESIRDIRQKYLHHDSTNAGVVISPILSECNFQETGINSIKLVIYTGSGEITFTCDVGTSIEHIISHAVCSKYDEASGVDLENFTLKVHGLAEYLLMNTHLFEYEYIHHCLKYDKNVEFDLIENDSLVRPLARTSVDDVENVMNLSPSNLAFFNQSPMQTIKKEFFVILLETFDREVEKLRANALNLNASQSLQVDGVIQAVKAICAILSSIETGVITEAVESLRLISELFAKSDFDAEDLIASLPFSVIDIAQDSPDSRNTKMEILQYTLERLNSAIWDLLEMYCKVFCVDFSIMPSTPSEETSCDTFAIQEIASLPDSVIIHVGTIHRIKPSWLSMFNHFQVMCTLYHGDRAISSALATKPISITKSFYPRLHFDEWLNFEDVLLCTLPRETRAVFKLYGIKLSNDSKGLEDNNTVLKNVGWNSVHLFSLDGYLVQGSVLYGLWPSSVKDVGGASISNTHDKYAPLIQVNFPEFSFRVLFPPVLQLSLPSQRKNFDSLEEETQQKLVELIEMDFFTQPNAEDDELLWDKRHYLYNYPQALPRVLKCAHSWDWACLSDIYNLINEWKPLQPVDALQLLLPCFPDIEVRRKAIEWLKGIGNDELCDYLPQIVQALKFDTWLNSATVEFLLERSLTNVRVAHHLYWLLKECKNDAKYGHRMNLYLHMLLTICGHAMKEHFRNQEQLMNKLTGIAERLKTTKESLRLQFLLRELESLHYTLCENSTSLPLSPSLQVDGLDIKSCSYFPSNTLPLKLSFKSASSGTIPAIYKVGDDLRQDSLTLQIIHIMDKLWLRNGLDLRIVTFKCISTGDKKGMLELVTDSETLRKIQTEFGVTGSFKDRLISEWLQKNNPSELEYQQAIENFSHSCAGYAVATYVLGICDRHNDNIMLKTSGHLFHIDFGKFLGDAQMFGNIKRDRVPFVLTSDMVYAINGGDRPSSKFQSFIDICCQAFNIIRHHSKLFLNLFSLVASAGIPGVSMDAVKYVQNVLLPGFSDAKATAHFTRLIEGSINSKSTQINFFIHNLAQMRFSGDHNDSALLSFVPKTYTMENDDRIISATLYGVQKRYDQEKYYVYVIKVVREKQVDPTYISRSYREFYEFDQKMHLTYPLAQYTSLPRDIHIGRSNIRQVAEKRKLQIDIMLKSLFAMADEVAHSDIVYTFFHPLLRDQQESAAFGFQNLDTNRRKRESVSLGSVRGQIKISLHYKTASLYIMVLHAKYLRCTKGEFPDAYVKTYLLPDPNKLSKRKTRVIRKNSHPSFMEMLIYELPMNVVKNSALQVSVLHYESLQENEFLGSVEIDFSQLNLVEETVQWYPLA